MISLGINCYYCAEENEELNITEKTKFIRSMQKLKGEHQMIKRTTIKKALKAFQDNRFGLFIHWGLYHLVERKQELNIFEWAILSS